MEIQRPDLRAKSGSTQYSKFDTNPRADPTRVRNQPSLTTSSGLVWLIVGGLLTVTGLAVLVPMIALGTPTVAWTGIVLLVAVYAAMVVVRFAVQPGRLRLGLMAVATIGIAVIALFCVGLITATEWNIVR